MIIQRELIATYSYEVLEQAEPFCFRLEIYKNNDIFLGEVFRLERYRLTPAFPDGSGEANIQDDALLYVRDEFINGDDLFGCSTDVVVSIFVGKLKSIFNLDNEN
jgi:hypothetical protein